MTTSINSATIDVPPPVQTARVTAPVVTSTGVADPVAIARQQLQSAVPAPALLAAYSSKIPQSPKPPARNVNPQPSSQLAAQLIGQEVGLDGENLAPFIPRATPGSDSPPPIAGDYLARPAIPSDDTANQATAARFGHGTESVEDDKNIPLALAVVSVAEEANLSTTIGSLAVLPSLFGKSLRRPSIAQSRGVDAYQLAASRNAVALATSHTAPSNL